MSPAGYENGGCYRKSLGMASQIPKAQVIRQIEKLGYWL